jgi:hypothetical protein
MKVDIYEIEYSVSPGGIDCWAVEAYSSSSVKSIGYKDGFATAGDALDFVVKLFPEDLIEATIKSNTWFQKELIDNESDK